MMFELYPNINYTLVHLYFLSYNELIKYDDRLSLIKGIIGKSDYCV